MEEAQAAAAAAARTTETLTQVGDLPEVCLAQAIARTSPRDACRCAAVSQAFRAAADSDQVWHTFLPQQLEELEHQRGGGGGDSSVVSSPPPPPPPQALRGRGSKSKSKSKSKKDAYLGLCDAASAVAVDGGGCRLWLERATGARCYALSARRLSLPWDDGEFSWRFTHHPRSRFAEVAELVDCTGLDIYGSLPAAALTPATTYAAFLVYGTAPEGSHRGLSYPDQETAVAVGGRVVARHAVCLRPDVAEARKFRGRGGDDEQTRRPRLREDGWWEMEMGRLHTPPPPAVIRVVSTPPPPLVVVVEDGDSDVVQASFEVLGWYPKRGLVVEGIEFRPLE